jgi:hypothetical protein
MAEAPPPDSSWATTAGELVALGVEQAVKYFLVYRPPGGTLEGAFWLGQKDHLIGFIPVDGTVENQWGSIIISALQASSFDGREAFTFWSTEGNGVTWEAGPVEEAADLAALRDLVLKASSPR